MADQEIVPVEAVTVPELVRQALASGRGREEMEIAERMLELQMRYEANEAAKAFAQAKARLKFPPIPKNKQGADGRTQYADYADMQQIIQPIYKAEDFDLSFDSSKTPDEHHGITIYGILIHGQGHQEAPRHCWQPIAPVSRLMNANQAMGNAISYGKRQLATMIFDLVLVGVDTDAGMFSVINEREILTLENLIRECKMGPESVSKYLDYIGVKALTDITRGEGYQTAFNWLLKKRAKVQEQAKAKK